VIEKATSFN